MIKSKVEILDDNMRVEALSEAPGLDLRKCWEKRKVFKIDNV